MAPWSSPVTQGITEVLAAQYNYLRLDVLDETNGHTHTGDDDGGKQVPFSKLDYSDAVAPAGLNNSLSEIDAHIGSVAGTYSSGVHGLHPSVHALGTAAIRSVIYSGFVAVTAEGVEKTITYPQTFASNPIVFVMAKNKFAMGAEIYSETVTGFKCKLYGTVSGLTGFNWLVIGVLT